MNKSNLDTARKVAALARLNFDEAGLAQIGEKFTSIMDFVGKLKNIDTKGVEATDHATAETPDTTQAASSTALRADEAVKFANAEKILEAAPMKNGRFFEVPKVIDNE